MNEKNSELLSALLDGELDSEMHDRTVDALLASGADDLARLGRYRAIGDALRGEYVAGTSAIAGRVSAALADEPVVLAPRKRSGVKWARPLTGMALAASVAAAAIVVAPQLLKQGPDMIGTSEIATVLPMRSTVVPSPQPLLAVAETADTAETETVSSWRALDDGLQDRLNRLVIEHHEFGGRTGINGPVSHIGLVSYEGR